MKEPSPIDKAILWNRERPLTPDELKGFGPAEKPRATVRPPHPHIRSGQGRRAEGIHDRGRSKGNVLTARKDNTMSWNKKMHTPESAKGMFDGRTKASLRSEQSRLRAKKTRTAAESKRLKRVNFALRAKNDFGKAR